MVITKINGGLGNQMFMYAAGRRLAHVLGVELKMDISEFANYPLRTYGLRAFNIHENIATPQEIAALTGKKQWIVKRAFRRLLHRLQELLPTHIKEKHFHFNPEILGLPDNVYLDGYWQSQKYFIDIENIIRREFTVKTPQTGQNERLAEMISSRESVSIHIRRGDFILNPEVNKVHGICDLGYYSRSVKQLTKKIKNPHFFIFSDDFGCVNNKLKLSFPTIFVDHNGQDKDYEDMRLMSQCKYHIIANSSFSWWGAWLSQSVDKVVFAPKHWFRENFNTIDLCPPEWILI